MDLVQQEIYNIKIVVLHYARRVHTNFCIKTEETPAKYAHLFLIWNSTNKEMAVNADLDIE